MDFVVAVVILILTTILCFPIFKSYKRKQAISKYIDHLPGEKKYPIIGTSLKSLIGSREMYWYTLSDRHKKFGPMFRSWIAGTPAVHIYKPEHAQIIFKSSTNLNKGILYTCFDSFLGQGLITGNLPKWRRHRKIITPAFHFKSMDTYAETFAEKGNEFAYFLDKFSGKGYFEIIQYLTQLSIDIISETAMGIQPNFLKNSESEYADAMIGYLSNSLKRIYNPLFHNDFLFGLSQLGRETQKFINYIRTFNKKVINNRKDYYAKNKDRMQQKDEFGRQQRMSFLDILLSQQESNNFDYTEIEEEVNTFMFAGHDTSTATICWTLMALGNHPDIMEKVQIEIDNICEGDPDKKITPSDIVKMRYLDMVVKEVLRLSAFVPFLGRELLEDVEIDGVHIPKGVNVIISLHDLHHDPEHHPDPWKFDPDRFLPENVEKRHPFAFVPFSAGPRNCIGQKFGMQNAKTILAYILRRHNVKCLEKPEDIKYYLEIVLRPQNGIHIAVEPRQR